MIQLIVIGIPGEDGYLTLMEDFPHVANLGADFGMTLGEVQSEPWWTGSATKRTVGRDQDGNPLWVDAAALQLKVQQITTPGALSWGGVRYNGRNYDINYRPPAGAVPYVGIQGCVVYDLTVAQAMNTGAYRVLAAWTDDPEDLPPALDGWGPFDPITDPRWANLRDPLVTIAAADPEFAGVADGWRTSNPEGHPVSFIDALKSYLQDQ
jgi:hypothetical protein